MRAGLDASTVTPGITAPELSLTVPAMAPVLAITGIFLYQRFGSDLDRAINSGLRSRAADVRALIGESDSGLREGRLKDETESFAEIIAPDGRLVDSDDHVVERKFLAVLLVPEPHVETQLLEDAE